MVVGIIENDIFHIRMFKRNQIQLTHNNKAHILIKIKGIDFKLHYAQSHKIFNYKFVTFLVGRATIDHSNPYNRSSTVNNNTTEMRITTNPLNMNYCDPDDCVTSSFNGNHNDLAGRQESLNVHSADSQLPIVDSSTYCKSKGVVPRHSNLADSTLSGVTDNLQIW